MILALIAAGVMALGAQPAADEPGFGLDNSQPIDLAAERCEALNGGQVVECTGAVRVVQGPDLMTADRMKIYTAENDGGFERIESEGNFRYTSGINAVSGDYAIYDGPANTITVTGDVVVVQGEQVMVGGKLIYNTVARSIIFSPGEDGRVRGLFHTQTADASTQGK